MESITPSRRDLPAGLGISAFGVFVLWMVLRDDGSSRNAPLWVALVAGGAFVLAGLAVAARAVATGPRRARWEAVSAALVAAVITGLGLIGAWIGFGTGERQSGARMEGPFLGSLPAHLTETFFRFTFGVSALFMLGLCVVVWSRLFRTLFRGARTPARAATAAVALGLAAFVLGPILRLEALGSGRTEPDPVFVAPFKGGFDAALSDGGRRVGAEVHGDDTRLVAGPGGGAVHFGGSGDWIDFALPDELALTGSVTLELRVNRDEWDNPYVPGSGRQTVAHAGPLAFSLSRVTRAGVVGFYPAARIFDDSLAAREMPMAPGAWHHVALVFAREREVTQLYVDGVRVAERNHFRREKAAAFTTLRLGTWHEKNQAFRGQVDDVRLFDAALSGETIARHAAEASGGALRR